MPKHKITIFILVFLLVIGGVGTVWGSQIAEAASGIWKSCPRGITNCAYPGKCRLYIDTNGDRICDRSQSAPQITTTVPSTISAAKAAATTTTTTPSAAVSSSGKTGTSAGGILAAAIPGNNFNTPPGNSQDVSATTQAAAESGYSYYFVPVFLATAFLYALTWILSARKIIRTLLHRKIWNIVLLVSMLVSALLGLFLILSIDFNINITLPFNMLFWHVEAGIALGIVGVFHILWHWRYFAKMFRASAPVVAEAKNEHRRKTAAPAVPPIYIKDSIDR
jgi:hypothetical protein